MTEFDGLPLLRSLWTVGIGERFTTASAKVHVVRPEIQERPVGGDSLLFELSVQTTGGKRHTQHYKARGFHTLSLSTTDATCREHPASVDLTTQRSIRG